MRTPPDAIPAAAAEREAASTSALALLRKFVPLSLSDVVMTLGDPLQTMALSRLPDTREVLAAVGIVKAIAVFLESPIIMILHASTALSRSAASRRALWRFTRLLGGALTAIFVLLAFKPIYDVLLLRIFGAGPSIAAIGRTTFLLVLPWPGIIAWRRFYQGVLIRRGKTRQVGWASLSRLAWVVAILSMGVSLRIDGALLAGVTLIGAVLVEAIAVTALAWRAKGSDAPAAAEGADPELPTSLAGVTRYYVPLAITMLIVWGGRAALTSLIARASDGLLALAAWPAGWGLVLSIANATRMVQQVVIAAGDGARPRDVAGFVLLVGILCSASLLLLGFTRPGATLLAAFLGEHRELVAAATPVLRIAAVVPFLVAVQNGLQGLLVRRAKNWQVNIATLAGVGSTLLLALLLIRSGQPGASSAAWAMVVGSVIDIAVLAYGLEWRARPE
ncbi:MAG: hypothetical protein QM820_45150 [Minicystis sp.]